MVWGGVHLRASYGGASFIALLWKDKIMVNVVTKMFKDAEIDAQIVKVNGSAMSLQQKIHNVAVSILKVWHDEKGVEGAALKAVARINALQDASPYHTRAFSVWVGMMLPLEWAAENKVWFGDVNGVLTGKMFIAARDLPFWKASPPPQAQPFIMADELQRILDKAVKRAEDPKDGDVVDVAAFKHLRDAIKVFNAVVE